mmetsp:Transcript_23372/g.78919  ORF Transcript_23372/g.78919 Transcript_23372/m.78919 type:complete len:228 (+) Transcript_23372:132-815(+)
MGWPSFASWRVRRLQRPLRWTAEMDCPKHPPPRPTPTCETYRSSISTSTAVLSVGGLAKTDVQRANGKIIVRLCRIDPSALPTAAAGTTRMQQSVSARKPRRPLLCSSIVSASQIWSCSSSDRTKASPSREVSTLGPQGSKVSTTRVGQGKGRPRRKVSATNLAKTPPQLRLSNCGAKWACASGGAVCRGGGNIKSRRIYPLYDPEPTPPIWQLRRRCAFAPTLSVM